MTKNDITAKVNKAFKLCKGVKICTQDNRKGRSAKRGLPDLLIFLEKPQKIIIFWEIKINDKPSDEQEQIIRILQSLKNSNIEADYLTPQNVDEKIIKMVKGGL